MNSIENKNLLNIIKFVQNFGENIPQKYLDILNVELAYARLICPFADENSIQLMNPESDDDNIFIPAFTSLEAFYEFFAGNAFMPRECNVLSLIASMSYDLTGIMINPASDEFFIDRSNLDEISPIDFPEFNFRDIQKSEFRNYLDAMAENDLTAGFKSDDFTDEYGPEKFKMLLDKLKTSGLLVLLATVQKVRGHPEDNIYNTKRLNEYGFYTMVNHTENCYFLAFSDVGSAVREQSHKMHNDSFFVSPISFPSLVSYVLEMDVDGIIINHSTNPIFLPRNVLIWEMDNIIEYSANPEIESYSKYSVMLK